MQSRQTFGDAIHAKGMLPSTLPMLELHERLVQKEDLWFDVCAADYEVAASEDEVLRFRVVAQTAGNDAPGIVRIRVFRYDIFRLPLMSSNVGSPEYGDHEVLVVDPLFDGTEVQAREPRTALKEMCDLIEDRLGLAKFDPTHFG